MLNKEEMVKELLEELDEDVIFDYIFYQVMQDDNFEDLVRNFLRDNNITEKEFDFEKVDYREVEEIFIEYNLHEKFFNKYFENYNIDELKEEIEEIIEFLG